MRIAILEDNHGIGRMLKTFLESAGYDAYPFNNSKDFLAFLTSSHVELIIVDYCLETMSNQRGTDVIREVRATFPDMPAILVSAAPLFVLKEASKDLPSVKVRRKPFKLSDLKKDIQILLGHAP